MRTTCFLGGLAIFLVALVVIAAYYYFRHRRRQRFPYGDWESLLKRLTLVDRDAIALIALDLIDESGRRRTEEDDSALEPSRIFTLIGGLEGLKVLERNCAVLVDLAFYVQQWYPEALAVAEHLRLNTREIEWHVSRLKGAARTGKLETAFADSAQRAIATYYMMTRRVLALYENGNLPGVEDLQRAL
ncbi:hypothetical protein [Tunturiibacter gelidiferens]|uniref:Uncharacterized protein n=1 Tax=Tunturiibacter gelidiferens TaxID=3069689 RepID=A0AAU7YZT4_9BACT